MSNFWCEVICLNDLNVMATMTQVEYNKIVGLTNQVRYPYISVSRGEPKVLEIDLESSL